MLVYKTLNIQNMHNDVSAGDPMHRKATLFERFERENTEKIKEFFFKIEYRTDGSVQSARHNKEAAEKLIQQIIDNLEQYSDIRIPEIQRFPSIYLKSEIM